jgi:hypothetical protein
LTLRPSTQALSSWPGLPRPSTHRRVNDGSDIGSAGGKGARTALLILAARTSRRIEHVDGRDKPGHDVTGANLSLFRLTPERDLFPCFT